MPPKPKYLNQEKAAEYIGLSARHLRQLEQNGEGPPSARVGRRKLYDVADLEAWMQARKPPEQE